MLPSIPSLLQCIRAVGEDVVDGGLCMAAERAGGVHAFSATIVSDSAG